MEQISSSDYSCLHEVNETICEKKATLTWEIDVSWLPRHQAMFSLLPMMHCVLLHFAFMAYDFVRFAFTPETELTEGSLGIKPRPLYSSGPEFCFGLHQSSYELQLNCTGLSKFTRVCLKSIWDLFFWFKSVFHGTKLCDWWLSWFLSTVCWWREHQEVLATDLTVSSTPYHVLAVRQHSCCMMRCLSFSTSNWFVHAFLSVVGFEVPDKFVVGYALDYNEYFRDLNVSVWATDFMSKLVMFIIIWTCESD